jgi:hypothetical protein
VIDVILDGQGPRAKTPVVVWVVGVPFHFYQLPILDMEENAASTVAPRSGGPGDGSYDFFTFLIFQEHPTSLKNFCPGETLRVQESISSLQCIFFFRRCQFLSGREGSKAMAGFGEFLAFARE